jgi:hypothetical protein
MQVAPPRGGSGNCQRSAAGEWRQFVSGSELPLLSPADMFPQLVRIAEFLTSRQTLSWKHTPSHCETRIHSIISESVTSYLIVFSFTTCSNFIWETLS